MPSATIENYAKCIHELAEQNPGRPVLLGEVALALGLTAGTVTTMAKSMAAAGLAEYQTRRGVTLTPQGRRLARHVLRRHRILELFLVKELGMDWAEVHEEAEGLEHSLSDRVLERMAQKLGNPISDPHGSPIPQVDGSFPKQGRPISLASCRAGTLATVCHIRRQEPDFLKVLQKHGIMPGHRISIDAVDRSAETLQCSHPGARPLVLSLQKAAGISVLLKTRKSCP